MFQLAETNIFFSLINGIWQRAARLALRLNIYWNPEKILIFTKTRIHASATASTLYNLTFGLSSDHRFSGLMPAHQKKKRGFEDQSPSTGGMHCYSSPNVNLTC